MANVVDVSDFDPLRPIEIRTEPTVELTTMTPAAAVAQRTLHVTVPVTLPKEPPREEFSLVQGFRELMSDLLDKLILALSPTLDRLLLLIGSYDSK